MLKSEYVKKQYEDSLLASGYVCLSDCDGIQRWADLQEGGQDIHHLIYQYPMYVDQMGALSPKEAGEAGAIYLIVSRAGRKSWQGVRIQEAVKVAREYPPTPIPK